MAPSTAPRQPYLFCPVLRRALCSGSGAFLRLICAVAVEGLRGSWRSVGTWRGGWQPTAPGNPTLCQTLTFDFLFMLRQSMKTKMLVLVALALLVGNAAGQATGTCPNASTYTATSCFSGATVSQNLGQLCNCYCQGSATSSPDDQFLISTSNTSSSMSGCSLGMCNAYYAASQSTPGSMPCFIAPNAVNFASATTTTGMPPPAAQSAPASACFSVTLTCTAALVGNYGPFCANNAAIGSKYTEYGAVTVMGCANTLAGFSSSFVATFCSTNNCNAPPPSSSPANIIKPVAGLLLSSIAAMLL